MAIRMSKGRGVDSGAFRSRAPPLATPEWGARVRSILEPLEDLEHRRLDA